MTARNLTGEIARGITHADARKEDLKLWCILELQTVRSLLSRPTDAQHYIYIYIYI